MTPIGCGGPSRADLIGTFTRTTPTVSETLQIRADGTFTQVINGPHGQVWTLTDTWVPKPRGITFDRFYETYDIEKQMTIIPPLEVGYRNCFWAAGSLVLGDSTEYMFYKSAVP